MTLTPTALPFEGPPFGTLIIVARKKISEYDCLFPDQDIPTSHVCNFSLEAKEPLLLLYSWAADLEKASSNQFCDSTLMQIKEFTEAIKYILIAILSHKFLNLPGSFLLLNCFD